MARRSSAPPGLTFARRFTKSNFSFNTYRVLVLAVTFLTYALYHEARKPPSIVKSVLDPEEEAELGLNALSHSAWSNHVGYSFHWRGLNGSLPHGSLSEAVAGAAAPGPAVSVAGSFGERAGWAPFNTADGKVKLGEIDLGFLACYAVGMYFAGHIGDRTDLRLFLTVGMLGSGLFVCLFGVGYWLDIHSFSFYLVMQMLAGLFQSTGWPSVVSVMANWFGKGQRGFIMGVWNAHTSVGNIAGSLISSAVLKYGWGWAFMVSGLMMIVGGGIVFLFLAVQPSDVGHTSPTEEEEEEEAEVEQADVVGAARDDASADALEKGGTTSEEEAGLLQRPKDGNTEEMRAVSFLEAWTIPGVAPFAFCLFFAKLVAYTFTDWLPFYIRSTEIGGRYLNGQDSGNLSTMYDVGGVIGGILAGFISDRMKGRAVTAASFMYLAIPALFMFRSYGYISIYVNIFLMLLMGMCINGPYALITTAVSADLGTHESLKGNARALSTVTAIIDGTGSVGAAMGPLLTGYISQWGWNSVFYMLMFSALVSGLLLTRLVIAELLEKCRTVSIMQDDLTGTITERLLSMKR